MPYPKLVEMDDANPYMPNTDVVLIVGANDVVNPAAETDPGSPIYWMPVLAADEGPSGRVPQAPGMRPGFAGIENELLFEPTAALLFGDAKDSLGKVLETVESL